MTTGCGTVYRRTTQADGTLPDPGFPYTRTLSICVAYGGRQVEDVISNTNFNMTTYSYIDIGTADDVGDVRVMRARLADERGFTLVELLAALVVGSIVIFAGFGLLDTAVRLQAKSVDSLDATDRGRVGDRPALAEPRVAHLPRIADLARRRARRPASSTTRASRRRAARCASSCSAAA